MGEPIREAWMNTGNRHRVPKKQWRKWSRLGRHVFNEVFSAMSRNAWAFQAPSVEKDPPTKRAWKTTAWNAAWIAADAADEVPIVGTVVDVTPRGSRIVGTEREMVH